MAEYTVTYFNAKAKGELSRLILSAAGKEFIDERLNQDAWQEFKPKTPYGQIPILTVNGKQINQSGVMQRYLAREFGLYGKNNIENTDCDLVLETVEHEVQPEFSKHYYASAVEKDDAKTAEVIKNLLETVYPKFLAFMDKMLKKNGTGYLVGSQLTVADLAFFCIQDRLLSTIGECSSFNDYPDLIKLFNTVKTEPNIQSYLGKRPDTPY